MAIRHKEAPVPRDLPPARLYLDDISEIAELFKEVLVKEARPGENEPITTVFSVDDKVCDEVQELAKIGGVTHNFELQIQKGYKQLSLYVKDYGSRWEPMLLSDGVKWQTHGHLENIFSARKLSFWNRVMHIVVQSDFSFIVSTIGGGGIILAAVALKSLLGRFLPSTVAIGISIVCSIVAFVFWMKADRPRGTVVLRNSSEENQSKLLNRRSLGQAILLLVVGSILTLLGQFIAHKLWH